MLKAVLPNGDVKKFLQLFQELRYTGNIVIDTDKTISFTRRDWAIALCYTDWCEVSFKKQIR